MLDQSRRLGGPPPFPQLRRVLGWSAPGKYDMAAFEANSRHLGG